MAKRLIPCLNRVLVEKIIPLSKTTAGILLPEKSSKLNSGKVIAVGPGTRDISGNTIPVAVKEGDTVLLPEYGGTEVKLGEKEYHLFRDDDILGTLHEMAAIDWSVCLHNVVFVTTQALYFNNPNISWRTFKRHMLGVRAHSDS
ncbi:hypothetical protein L1987_11065 [Smallanthus sonchifolius]|uniref:Uncharacterized protein n=1 Tax=Smallanthus sonchifolius TaxID=185202 RepID=A0ACB9JC39_9ASTR|nr:hypothetical protein L1987_11065 [Smallanthus sonchifolius]